MDDNEKTKEQLAGELVALRKQVERLDKQDRRRRLVYQEEREESKLHIKRFRTLARVSPIGILVSNTDGKCWYVNQEWCAISGATSTEINDSGWERFVHSDDRVVFSEWQEAVEKARQFRSQYRFQRPDGSIVWVWGQGIPEQTQDGKVTGFITTITDITRLKQAEEKEHFLAAIVNSSDDEIIGQTLDGIIVSWNSGAERMYGYTENEVIGKSISILESPERKNEISECLDEIKNGKKIEHFETVRLCKNGTQLDVSLTLSPIEDEHGGIIGVSAIARDIADQKRAEEKNRYLAAIVNSSDDEIIGQTLEGMIVSWNDGAERMYGYKKSETVGKSITILESADRKNEIFDCLNQIRDGKKIEHFETVRVRKDGTQLDVSLNLSPIYDENGKIAGASAVARDITEQKKAEERIRYLAAIVNSSDDAIIGKSLDGRIVSWNHGAELMYGYKESEIIGDSITILEAPGRKNEIFDCLNQIRDGKKIEHFETVRVRKDGTQLDVSLNISPIEDEHGGIIGASAIDRVIPDSSLPVA